jgi:hypothetical protein
MSPSRATREIFHQLKQNTHTASTRSSEEPTLVCFYIFMFRIIIRLITRPP